MSDSISQLLSLPYENTFGLNKPKFIFQSNVLVLILGHLNNINNTTQLYHIQFETNSQGWIL